MPLTTVDAVKRMLGIAALDTSHDDFIEDCVADAEAMIENYCERTFSKASYTDEQHTINHVIFPNHYPIISIEKIVRIYGGAETDPIMYEPMTFYKAFPTYVEFTDFKYVTMTNKLQYETHEESYIEISYTAGYEDADIPADIKLAGKMLAAYLYQTGPTLGYDNEKIGDYSVKYNVSIPQNVTRMLDKYKKVRC